MSSKLQNALPDNTNTLLPSGNSMSLLALDYNIVEDMKKTRANISLCELIKLTGQRDILLRALDKTSIGNVASSSKGPSKSPRSFTSVLNVLRMEEANSHCPPFLLSFEIFNFIAHYCLVDSGASVNAMPLSIAKQINVQWSSTNAQIIQLDRTCVPAIGELRDVIIQLSSDERVHQCNNIVIVDIPEAYGLLLNKDWTSKLQGYFATD